MKTIASTKKTHWVIALTMLAAIAFSTFWLQRVAEATSDYEGKLAGQALLKASHPEFVLLDGSDAGQPDSEALADLTPQRQELILAMMLQAVLPGLFVLVVCRRPAGTSVLPALPSETLLKVEGVQAAGSHPASRGAFQGV
jgi:hypothetical protein